MNFDTTINDKKYFQFFILILLFAAILRFPGLDRMSLWGDEACMVYLCQESIPDIVEALASADRPDVDVAPPLYFVLLHLWMKLLGTSLHAFRGFSALFGVLTVGMTMALSRHLFSKKVALFVGVFMAINPFQVWYSQEGRMYAMASFLAATTLWALAKALKKPEKPVFWAAYTMAGLALIYTQYYGALLLAAMVAFLLWEIVSSPSKRKNIIQGTAGSIIVWTVGFAPWLPVLVTDYHHAGAPGGFPLMFHWLQTPAFLFLKSTVFGSQTYVLDHLWLYPIPLVMAGLATLHAMKFFRKIMELRMVAFAFLLPFSLVYVLSLLGMRVYKSHPFIIFHPAFIVLLVYGLLQFKPWFKWLSIGSLVSAQVIVLGSMVLAGDYIKPPSEVVASWIEVRGGDQADVAVIPAFVPNPMPIVGDLLAFKYHSGDRFSTCYLTGNNAADLVNGIKQHAANSHKEQNIMFVVCQVNEQVQPVLDEIFRELDRQWQRQYEMVFPSKNRGFTMMSVEYEIPEI